MADKYELLSFDQPDLVMSHEDAQDAQKYKRAKAMAEQRGVKLHIAPPAPAPWQPPEGSLTISHEEAGDSIAYRAAKAEAEANGLELVVAPEKWRGPRVRTGPKPADYWEPPERSIVVPANVSFDDYSRARETADRLGVPVVLAPESVPMPEKLPERIVPGVPVVIPRNATPQEYRRLKALAEERHVPYHVGE